jgi:hypothetical protein
MSRFEGGFDDAADETSVESTIKFLLTLIVTTVIVAAAIYVLGSPVLDGGAGGPAHRAAIAALHARS